jgi:hypothetical protein
VAVAARVERVIREGAAAVGAGVGRPETPFNLLEERVAGTELAVDDVEDDFGGMFVSR